MTEPYFVNLICANDNKNNKCSYIKPDKLSKLYGIDPITKKPFTKFQTENMFNRFKSVCNSHNGNIDVCCDKSNNTEEELVYLNKFKEKYKSVKIMKNEKGEIKKIILSVEDNNKSKDWEEITPYILCKMMKSKMNVIDDEKLEFTNIPIDCFNSICHNAPEFSINRLVGLDTTENQFFNKKKNDDETVVNLVKNQSFEKIKSYLLKYKDTYYKPLIHNNKYNNLLHYSVIHNYKYLLEFLIKANNDINIKNADGDTPLHLAVLYKNFEMAYLLNKLGADVNIKNNKLETPVFLAVKHGDLNMLTFLNRNSASLIEKDNNNNNLIHISILNKPEYTLVNYLINQGLDLTEKNKYGLTPVDILNLKLNAIKDNTDLDESYKKNVQSISSLISRRNFKNKHGYRVLETNDHKDFMNVKDWICYDKEHKVKNVQSKDKCNKKDDYIVPIYNNLNLKLKLPSENENDNDIENDIENDIDSNIYSESENDSIVSKSVFTSTTDGFENKKKTIYSTKNKKRDKKTNKLIIIVSFLFIVLIFMLYRD